MVEEEVEVGVEEVGEAGLEVEVVAEEQEELGSSVPSKRSNSGRVSLNIWLKRTICL